MVFRAVLFDFFGTLTCAVRRGPVHTYVAELLGCPPAVWMTLLDRTFYLRAAGRLGEPIDVLDKLARSRGAKPDRRSLYRAYAARLDAILADAPLREDAVDVLTALRRTGLRTAVVSDCWYELPMVMPRLPVARLLDATVYSVHVGRCKPDPLMYHTACERLGVEPAECLFVGDGGSRELTGAEAAGLTPVRLAAPDLAGHLTFGRDTWQGPQVATLSDLLPRLGIAGEAAQPVRRAYAQPHGPHRGRRLGAGAARG